MTRPVPAAFLAQLRDEAFGLGASPAPVARVGAEVEFIPVVTATGRVAAIEHAGHPSTLPVLRALSRRLGWCEVASATSGTPEFHTATSGRITFEPGGQIEYSAPPGESVSDLVADLHAVVAMMEAALGEAGIHLVFSGVDPLNAIEDAPLRLTAPRYRRMDAHFATIGPHGARMMRQTASIQICLDAGARPLERWQLLNALAPWLVAIFANSPVYAGRPTGHRSVRRFIWGALDPARTGLVWDPAEPVEAYARFALHAASILEGRDEPPFPPFGQRTDPDVDGLDRWRAHLTTLFPEVRPRGYFEVRSIDALAPRWYAAPLVFLAGLAYDARASREALAIAGPPDPALLERAGRCGLADPVLAAGAAALFPLALQGAESLGGRVIGPEELDVARAYHDRYTRHGLAPADERVATVRA